MPETENDKIQIGIYRIDKALFPNLDNMQIIDQVIEAYNRNVETSEKFTQQRLNDTTVGNFTVSIFYSEKSRIPKWRPFLVDILHEDSPLASGRNKDVSYISFFADVQNLYAISGGQGNFIIQNYIDQNFGIGVITRLISKDSPVIKSLQDRGVTGTILGSTKFFRGDYKLSSEDQFGKIYKQIKADLQKQILVDHFGFTNEEIKKGSGCIAKSSFQINKSIDFGTLLRVLEKLSEIWLLPEKFPLNKVTFIPNRGKKNKDLIINLKTTLINKLYEYCLSNTEIDFDFTHPDFDKYLSGEKFIILRTYGTAIASFDEIESLPSILDYLKEQNILDLSNLDSFLHSLASLRIKSIDGDGNYLTVGNFMHHIHGEIEFLGKTYFLIDKEWYEIQPEFITDLNKDLADLIKEHRNDELLDEIFNLAEDENDYNKRYIDKEGYIVLDKVTPENIEVCDILKYTDNAIYLIHVKKGFKNSVRDLSAQVLISSKLILNDMKSDFSYIDKLETKLKAHATSTDPYFKSIGLQTLPTGGLRGIFKGKKTRDIHFCFAFVDTAVNNRDINNPNSYRSNIAKFSLIELQKEVIKDNLGFSVIQIRR